MPTSIDRLTTTIDKVVVSIEDLAKSMEMLVRIQKMFVELNIQALKTSLVPMELYKDKFPQLDEVKDTIAQAEDKLANL